MKPNLFVILGMFFCGCVKQVNLHYRTPQPTLVAEGLLLTDSTPCKVVLSYSGLFNASGGQLPQYITDATVFICKDGGDSIPLHNNLDGSYTENSNAFHAEENNAYHITIHLANGEKYASIPEKILPVPKDLQLDSIGVAVPTGLLDLYGEDIQIKTKDPADQKNYYRWITTDYIPRKATGVPCNAPQLCDMYCYQQYFDNGIHILSDGNINGNEIRNQTVLVSPYFDYGAHYMEIKQLSLTQEAYQFWKLYQDQTGRTGSILDPLPSPLTGNIYNVDNPGKFALGYFEASDVVSLKLVIAPIFLNSYYTLAYVGRYIYPDIGSCWNVYPNAYQYVPSGWENVPEIIYNVY